MGVDGFRLLKEMRGIYGEFSSPVLRKINYKVTILVMFLWLAKLSFSRKPRIALLINASQFRTCTSNNKLLEAEQDFSFQKSTVNMLPQAVLDTVHLTNFVQSRRCRWRTDSFTFVRVVSSIFTVYQVIYDYFFLEKFE